MVDCKGVGSGQKVVVYLGRYLYRGVIQENDIIACDKGRVSYCWREQQVQTDGRAHRQRC